MEEGLPKVPKLELAQLKFVLSKEAPVVGTPGKAPTQAKTASQNKDKLLAGIILDSKRSRPNHAF